MSLLTLGNRTCVTGTKVLCSKDGCAPACVPGQINFSCLFGVIGICDAGCGKYVCGGCVSGGQGFSKFFFILFIFGRGGFLLFPPCVLLLVYCDKCSCLLSNSHVSQKSQAPPTLSAAANRRSSTLTRPSSGISSPPASSTSTSVSTWAAPRSRNYAKLWASTRTTQPR